MATGPEFRIGMDGSQAMSVLGQLQNKMKDVGNTAKSELAQKLTSVFSVVAVEEMVRRTGEWAKEIAATSKEIGISAEALQTLQNIASKTGLPTDAVTGMFENIAKAREQALAGNKELVLSFQKIGVTLSDLQNTTKSGLFGKVLQGLTNQGFKVNSPDGYLRQAVAQVTGNTPENYISAVQSQVPGGNFTQAIETGKREGGVLPEATISSLAATMSAIGQDFREVGNELKPVAGFILNIVHTFSTALLALTQAFGDVKNIIVGWFGGDTDKIKKSLLDLGALFANLGWGILKPFISALDILANAIVGVANSMIKIHNMIPGTTKWPTAASPSRTNPNALLEKDLAGWNKTLGISETTGNRGQALGLAATIVGPEALVGGTSAIVKSTLSTTKAVMKDGLVATGTGMVRDAVQTVKDIIKENPTIEAPKPSLPTLPEQPSAFVRADEFKKALKDLGVNVVSRKSEELGVTENAYFDAKSGRRLTDDEKKAAMEKANTIVHDAAGVAFKKQLAYDLAKRGISKQQLLDREAAAAAGDAEAALTPGQENIFRKAWNAKFPRRAGPIVRGGVGVYSGMMAGMMAGQNNANGTSPIDTLPIIPNIGQFQNVGGGGNPMLKMGGVFGSGFESRLIVLTEEIAKNIAKMTVFMSQMAGPSNNINSQSSGL